MLSRLYRNLFFAITSCMLSLSAFAQEAPPTDTTTTPTTPSSVNTLSAADIITNLATQVPAVMQMVTAIAYVLGMYFIIMGVLKLKHLGESRTMMSQEHSIKGPLTLLAVGALLIYLPTSVQLGTSTFWSNESPISYVLPDDQWGDFINDCYLIVQLIGTIAFIRGLVILSHLGSHGGQPGQFSKGLTHIIGGIFCINIVLFVQVVMNTLGIQP